MQPCKVPTPSFSRVRRQLIGSMHSMGQILHTPASGFGEVLGAWTSPTGNPSSPWTRVTASFGGIRLVAIKTACSPSLFANHVGIAVRNALRISDIVQFWHL